MAVVLRQEKQTKKWAQNNKIMMIEKITDIELIGAKETAKLLGVNPNKVYDLWNKGMLTWWSIGGTKKTTKEAIAIFLHESQNKELTNEK